MPHQLEAVVIEHGVDIAPRAGEIIVGADDARALRQQPLAQMRTEKAGAAGHQHTGFKMHRRPLPGEFLSNRNGIAGPKPRNLVLLRKTRVATAACQD